MAEQFQEFSRLQKQLNHLIDPNSSISKTLQTELKDAQQSLVEAKQYYYQQLLMYTELKEILLENNYGLVDLQYEDAKLEEQDRNIFKLVSETLSQVEAKNSLNISMKGRSFREEQLFGLNTDDFELEPKKKKNLHQNIQQHCIPLIEKRLKNKCLEVFRFWNPSCKDSEGLALAKSNQLSTAIDNEKKKYEEAKATLKLKEKELVDDYKQFNNNISAALQNLEEKVEQFTQKPNLEGTKITVDWLAAKSDYILCKIMVMKNHLISQTYTSEAMEALGRVRNHLVQEIVRTQNELQRTKQSLYTYESVGETFTKLLNQYTQLTMEIDNKKWALAELNKSAES